MQKAETQLGPGGNVFPLRGCRSGSERPHRIYISIPQRRVDRGKEKEDTCRKRVKWREQVIELINLMAPVAHLTSHSLTASPLESTGDKGAHGERLSTRRTKNKTHSCRGVIEVSGTNVFSNFWLRYFSHFSSDCVIEKCSEKDIRSFLITLFITLIVGSKSS